MSNWHIGAASADFIDARIKLLDTKTAVIDRLTITQDLIITNKIMNLFVGNISVDGLVSQSITTTNLNVNYLNIGGKQFQPNDYLNRLDYDCLMDRIRTLESKLP